MRVPTPQSIRRQIDDLVSRLIELGLADDQNATVLKRTAKAGFEIGFSGTFAIFAVLRERDYEAVYAELADARAYNPTT